MSFLTAIQFICFHKNSFKLYYLLKVFQKTTVTDVKKFDNEEETSIQVLFYPSSKWNVNSARSQAAAEGFCFMFCLAHERLCLQHITDQPTGEVEEEEEEERGEVCVCAEGDEEAQFL